MTKGNEIQIGDGSLHIGDRVVYPNQGICRIVGVESLQIAGQSAEFVKLTREDDPSGAIVRVPRAKVMGIGLRKVATKETIDEVFDYLASPSDDPQLDWKVRKSENADKMTGGGLFGTAEVLKGLHALTRIRPLPAKERALYDSARHLLIGEIAAACEIPLHIAENNLDYALFPPPGMKRKGRELKMIEPSAALAMRPLRGDDDEDLGLDDEEAAAEEETETKESPKDADEGADADEGGDAEPDEKPVKKAAKEKPAKAPAKEEKKAKPEPKAKPAAKEEKKAKPAPKAAPKEEKKAKAEKPAAKAKPAAKPAKPAAKKKGK